MDVVTPEALVQGAAQRDRMRGLAAFPALRDETREVIPTDAAAHHLNRKPQTLRIWACREDGPIRPVRINGRLGWRTADIRRLVGMS